MEKLVNELYEYSQSFDRMSPRGDGAQLEAACEVHRLCHKIANILAHQVDKPEKLIDSASLLLELAESMVLDKIDPSLTPEILEDLY